MVVIANDEGPTISRVEPKTSFDSILVIFATDEYLVKTIDALSQQKSQVATNISDEAVEVVDYILEISSMMALSD